MSAVPSHFSTATCASAARVYRRRRPERTVLYWLVQQHLETWLACRRETDLDGNPVARHIERELRAYLECGILACGFARARCGACGHDFLVAFSCKGRGLCPSCTTRRMAATAAHLVEHVFPQVPVRHGAFTPDVAADLARWGHGGGFSLHAGVRIEAKDRAGLERLLRYCARPAFASERLAWDGSDQPVRYTLPKPLPTGQTELTLDPLELLDRLAALIPPPRRHRHHYAGVFAPHANLRARVTACAGQPVAETAPVTAPGPDPMLPATTRRRASIHWARLLAHIYEVRPLTCPRCQGDMRLIAFLTEPRSIRALLAHLGEPTTPPPLTPRARGPPELESEGPGTPEFAFDQSPSWDPTTPAPDPGYPFDQTLN